MDVVYRREHKAQKVKPPKAGGKADRNLTLTLLWAENTIQTIRDILGAKFAIPYSNIKSSGKGKNLAIQDGRPDNVPDPRYRRSDVFLNTRLVISLKAL